MRGISLRGVGVSVARATNTWKHLLGKDLGLENSLRALFLGRNECSLRNGVDRSGEAAITSPSFT